MRPIPRTFVPAALLVAAALASSPAPAAASDASDRLAAALADGVSEELRVEAVEAARGAEDPDVVKLLAKALRDRSLSVRRAAIESLGATPGAESLAALHSLYRGDEKLREDEETFVLLLRTIGRRGDPSSVEILTDEPFDEITQRTARARVLGLGRIRTASACEGLVSLSKLFGQRRRGAGASDQREIQSDFRVAFGELTGQDLGTSQAEWQRWWRENGKSLKVAPERPPLPAMLTARWEQYWGEPYRRDAAGAAPSRGGAPFTIVANPQADVVKAAVSAIDEAFRKGTTTQARCAAIEANAGVDDADVVAAVSKGLRDPSQAVQLAAIDALGWMPSKDALRALHRLYQRDEDLRKDELVFAHLLQAIGRHGDASSVAVLKDDVFDELTLTTGRARIMAAARIRDRKSVELLMWGMQLGGNDPRGRRSAEPRFMDYCRVALVVLTGEDLGTSKQAWLGWWRDNDSKFKVAKERPQVPADVKAVWEEYWNETY